MPSIQENMESMEVRIHASIEEQRRIATILNKLDCKIELNRQINDNLPWLDHSLKGAKVRLAA